MELFRFILPKAEICQETELYFHSYPSPEVKDSIRYCQETRQIELKKGAGISFDTYFNCYSYAKYRKYTWVKQFGVSLLLQGKFVARLIAASQSQKDLARVVLQEQIIHHDRAAEFRLIHEFSPDHTGFNRLNDHTAPAEYIEGTKDTVYNEHAEHPEGIYYIELHALSDTAIFFGGYYFIEENAELLNPVKVAFIICTYKREEFVYRNIETIKRYLIDPVNSNVKDCMSFLIIDNGQTLDASQLESPYVKVFKNKNYGGSGGFTRGLLEAYLRRDEYTHVLLMDDDIIFEGEVLAKTINLLKILKPEYQDSFIGAGMIVKDRPYLQHEAGVLWQGLYPVRRKADLDLRQRENVVFNEREEELNYSGWWYMCMPLDVVNQHQLPFPFFIKADDIEYSIRSARRILLMSGIGVWHEHFDNKHSSLLEYYLKRNEAVLAAVHFPELGALAHIKKLLFALGKRHLQRSYSAHSFLFLAYEDFLKGVDFFLQTDAEEQHRRLIEKSRIYSDDGSLLYFPVILIKSGIHFLVLSIRLLGQYKKIAQSYRLRRKEITSLEFWERYLDIVKGKSDGE